MKDILLDTHALLWFFNGDEKLSLTARRVINNENHKKIVSVASLWEITIKISLGKLEFTGGINGILKLIDENGFEIISIFPSHIIQLEKLSSYHKDPFDRILIATAISEDMEIVSIDENFKLYNGLQLIW